MRLVCATAVAIALLPAAEAGAGELTYISNSCDQGGPCLNAVWRARDDGSLLRRVTRSYDPYKHTMWPTWSPEGGRIVFVGPQDEVNSGRLTVVDANGGELRHIAPQGLYATQPEWSPKAEIIAFAARFGGGGGLPDSSSDQNTYGVEDRDIFLIGSDGSNLRRIVNGGGHEERARFSPDGSRVTFHRLGTGPLGLVGEADDSGWYSVALDGSDERRLTVGFPPLPHPSPDGRFVAFVNAYRELFTMRADGSDLRHWPGYAGTLAWSAEEPALFVEHGSISKIDFSGPEPTRRMLFRTGPLGNGGIDWTGAPPTTQADTKPPATVLLGPKERPLGLSRGRARISSRRQPVPSVARSQFRFFAHDSTGVRRVEVSFGRIARGGHCRYLGARSFGRLRSCHKPVFRRVRSDAGWRKRVKRLRRGTYRVGFRTLDVRGNRTRKPRFTTIRIR